jgi:transposase InsO family protein
MTVCRFNTAGADSIFHLRQIEAMVLDGRLRWCSRETPEAVLRCKIQVLTRWTALPTRTISDNGPRFTAKDFKEFIRISGTTHA